MPWCFARSLRKTGSWILWAPIEFVFWFISINSSSVSDLLISTFFKCNNLNNRPLPHSCPIHLAALSSQNFTCFSVEFSPFLYQIGKMIIIHFFVYLKEFPLLAWRCRRNWNTELKIFLWKILIITVLFVACQVYCEQEIISKIFSLRLLKLHVCNSIFSFL